MRRWRQTGVRLDQSRDHQKLGETREGHMFGPAETLIWSPDTNNKILIT